MCLENPSKGFSYILNQRRAARCGLVWITAVFAIAASKNAKTRLRAGLQPGEPLRKSDWRPLSPIFPPDSSSDFSKRERLPCSERKAWGKSMTVRNRFRGRSVFIADHREFCRPLDRNGRARITFLAEALERRSKHPGDRNGLLGYTALTVLRAFLFTFLRRSDGLCCPSVAAIHEVTGLAESTIHEALDRLERTGLMKRMRRLVWRVVDIGGVARRTAVQTTNLYRFSEPAPHAHLLPIEKRASRTGAARLLAALTRTLTARTELRAPARKPLERS